jgi:hypothetical protein
MVIDQCARTTLTDQYLMTGHQPIMDDGNHDLQQNNYMDFAERYHVIFILQGTGLV